MKYKPVILDIQPHKTTLLKFADATVEIDIGIAPLIEQIRIS